MCRQMISMKQLNYSKRDWTAASFWDGWAKQVTFKTVNEQTNALTQLVQNSVIRGTYAVSVVCIETLTSHKCLLPVALLARNAVKMMITELSHGKMVHWQA